MRRLVGGGETYVETIKQLRQVIETIQPTELDIKRTDLLALVDALPFVFGVGSSNGNGDAKHVRLSPREREVMTMILNGRRLKEIAANLDISVKTVTTHRSRLLRKLGVEDNLGLYRYGIRNGLIGV
jgi:DNA-binding CsgD family transcriptional regulator